MDKVNDKIGNVRLFKKHLRKQGLIGNRQQFSEEHIKIFEEIKEYKKSRHTTWEIAFKSGLNAVIEENAIQAPVRNYISEPLENNIEYLLNEILITLKRIEEKL